MKKHWKAVSGMVMALALMFGGASAASAQQIYDSAQLTEKPRIASPMAAQRAIERAYPASLRDAGVEGRVMIQAVVLASGQVDPASLAVQSADNARLGDAAKAAVAGIEFVPGAVEGTAVASRVVFPITFVSR